jgi:WD40 repeat protein
VVVLPNGYQFLSASFDGKICLWDLLTGTLIRSFVGNAGFISCVAIAPNGQHAVSASVDGILRLWDIPSGRQIRILGRPRVVVNSVAVTPEGRHALYTAGDGKLVVVDLATDECVAVLPCDPPPWCLAIAADGQTVIVGDKAGDVSTFRWVGLKPKPDP